MKIAKTKPVKVFLIAIIVSLGGIYGLCDYWLQSIGRELMLNWARSESALIQEGNLLTSSTKNQRFLLSSDYIQGIKLVKFENNQTVERLHFGSPFKVDEIPSLVSEITVQRVGFLHSRAFYQIPSQQDMFMVFDVESKVLNSVFFGSAVFILFIVLGMIATIRNVQEREYLKREELFKQALNDFVSNDKPSEIVKRSFPKLATWWKDKKDQLEAAQAIAIKNQSKIELGEIASRVGHDIIGSVRNAEILARRTQWGHEKHKEMFFDSLSRIKQIVSEISKHSKSNNSPVVQNNVQKFNLNELLSEIVKRKQVQYEGQCQFEFINGANTKKLFMEADQLELERSLSNLINNAVEASALGSIVQLVLKKSDEQYEICILDQGKGISSEVLAKIGAKNFTVGKENGTGIGIYYAKQFIEGLGGKLKISSELGKGTSVTLAIPNYQFQPNHEISILEDEQLLFLDDQESIRMAIEYKMSQSGVPPEKYSIFSSSKELEKWISASTANFKLYSDYFLESNDGQVLETGADVIKRLNLQARSVIVSSAFDDPTVYSKTNELKVPILSKEQFFEAEVVFL